MATGNERSGSVAPTDDFLAALTAGAQDRPESRVLDHLVGRWRVTTDWEPIVGHGVRRSEGRIESRWIFGGRVLESRTFDTAGTETALLLCAFDPTIGDYAAYTVNALSHFFILERGHHDAEAARLVFEGLEPLPDGRPSVRYHRTIELTGADTYASAISYPDVPPGTYGPMSMTYERLV